MAVTAVITSVVAAVAGITESIIASTDKPKSPSSPAAPSTSTAAEAAKSAQLENRKTFLAAGGQTDFTGGLGILTGSDVGKSTLVGS
jgi:hypothetical protein